MTNQYYVFRNIQGFKIVATSEHEAKLCMLAAARILNKDDVKMISFTDKSFYLEQLEPFVGEPIFGFLFELQDPVLQKSNIISGVGEMAIPLKFLIETVANSKLTTGADIDAELPAT